MRLTEFLIETGNAPAPFHLVTGDDEYWEIASPEIGLTVYLSLNHAYGGETVFIEFAVNGKYDATGDSQNPLKIFSTVKAILAKYLPGFARGYDFVTFGAEKSEPSRIKLYNRAVPVISQILGPEWQFSQVDDGPGSIKQYLWKHKRTLKEKAVQSTWITDLRHSRAKKELTMTLNNGRQFLIPGVTRATFEQWTRAPSKGRYFHNRIKGKYQVTRTK